VIALERLIEGLSVEAPPRSRLAPEPGVITISGGVTVRLSPHSIAVLPSRGAAVPGVIRVTFQDVAGVFDHLRTPLIEPLSVHDPIRRAFEDLLEEVVNERPGSRAMVETLARRWLILFLRRCCRHARPPWWVAALQEPRLGRVIAAMQDRPHQAFTLAELADLAAMSRSVFAARFTDVLGQSPMEFLQALRLAKAAELLAATDLPVKIVASRVGYSSRSSFTRAFVARQGAWPTAFRAGAGDAGRAHAA
jgi:AraC-like DNA-binding protein